MGPDIFILDLLKSEVSAREKNPCYGNNFCTSWTLRVKNTCKCTCIKKRDSYLADKVTICGWRDAASEEQSIMTKLTWLNCRGS